MFNLPLAPQTVEASVAVPGDFDRSLQNLSDWMLAAPAQRKLISEALSLQTTFYLAYRDGNHVERLSRFGDLLAACSLQDRLGPLPERKKLRLVVVSNYFRRHSVWDGILRGILVNLDRARFEVLLYNTGNIDDGETKLARSLSDGWKDFHTVAGLNGCLEAMAADRPDAIFYPEMGMDQMTLHLATRRLAPVQGRSPFRGCSGMLQGLPARRALAPITMRQAIALFAVGILLDHAGALEDVTPLPLLRLPLRDQLTLAPMP